MEKAGGMKRMDVRNCMEDCVRDNIESVLRQYPEACHCDHCVRDILILALNHLPPKYVATDRGDTYTRLSLCTPESTLAITQEIAKAIEIVMRNPRHS